MGQGLKIAAVLVATAFSSCALLVPTAVVNLERVPADYVIAPTDTTESVLEISSNMHADFSLNGSNMVKLEPGDWEYLAAGIAPGWYYMNIVSADTWVRNVPVFLRGGDRVPIDVGPNHLDIDGKIFFDSYQGKSTLYSFYPMLSLSCYGCTTQPLLRFDGNETAVTQPWITVTPGWHSIEIYSPLDHVQLYYRTLFDNYTITEFELHPISTF